MTEELIPGTDNGVSNETPGAEQGVAQQPAAQPNATPVQTAQVDVESLRKKYENDINGLKSSLQRREAQVNAEWEKKYNQLQNQMHQVRMERMTEEDRKVYESNLQNEEFQNLQNRLQQIESERNQFAQMMDGMDFFLKQGVPAEKLVLNEGYDAMVRSGWDHITSELNRYRQGVSNPQPQKPAEPSPLPRAPGVVTDKGTPAVGTTWADLIARFGSAENAYRAVEEGRADPRIIPV